MKEKIQDFAETELNTMQEEKLEANDSTAFSEKLSKLSMLLLGLASIESDLYEGVLSSLQETFNDPENMPSLEPSLHLLIQARMALAAYHMKDSKHLNLYQTQLCAQIPAEDEADRPYQTGLAMAILASLSPENYARYQQALTAQAASFKIEKPPTKYLITLAWNAFAASQVSDVEGFKKYTNAMADFSYFKNIKMPILSHMKEEHFPKWITSLLQLACLKMGDKKKTLDLQAEVKPLKARTINNYDELLAFANELVQERNIVEGSRTMAKQRALATAEAKEEIAERIFTEADRSLAPHSTHHFDSTIIWQSYFQYMGKDYVLPKEMGGKLSPKPVWVFAHWESQYLHFTAHEDSATASIAKACISEEPSSVYPDGNLGYVYVDTLKSHLDTYRMGTYLLMNYVFPYSVKLGHEGRICLYSAHESGLFYLKLGFLPTHMDTFLALISGEKVSGGGMYLTAEAALVWKDKLFTVLCRDMSVASQTTEKMCLNAASKRAQWQQVINRLSHGAISELVLSMAYPHELSLQALTRNQSLETIVFDGSFLEKGHFAVMEPAAKERTFIGHYSLSELLNVFTSHARLKHIIVRNYPEKLGNFDMRCLRALSVIILAGNRLTSIHLENMKIESEQFVLMLDALNNSAGLKKLVLKNMQFSEKNLKQAQLSPHCEWTSSQEEKAEAASSAEAQTRVLSSVAGLLANVGSFPAARSANQEAHVMMHVKRPIGG